MESQESDLGCDDGIAAREDEEIDESCSVAVEVVSGDRTIPHEQLTAIHTCSFHLYRLRT